MWSRTDRDVFECIACKIRMSALTIRRVEFDDRSLDTKDAIWANATCEEWRYEGTGGVVVVVAACAVCDD